MNSVLKLVMLNNLFEILPVIYNKQQTQSEYPYFLTEQSLLDPDDKRHYERSVSKHILEDQRSWQLQTDLVSFCCLSPHQWLLQTAGGWSSSPRRRHLKENATNSNNRLKILCVEANANKATDEEFCQV